MNCVIVVIQEHFHFKNKNICVLLKFFSNLKLGIILNIVRNGNSSYTEDVYKYSLAINTGQVIKRIFHVQHHVPGLMYFTTMGPYTHAENQQCVRPHRGTSRHNGHFCLPPSAVVVWHNGFSSGLHSSSLQIIPFQ